MDIRYSPYQSPFVPSYPKGVYWIGAEFKDAPHSAHVWAYTHHLGRLQIRAQRTEEQIHIEAVSISASSFRRPFLSVCGCTWCHAAARKMSREAVAAPVTPPLSLMGETFHANQGVF